jgi:hypothetical protein
MAPGHRHVTRQKAPMDHTASAQQTGASTTLPAVGATAAARRHATDPGVIRDWPWRQELEGFIESADVQATWHDIEASVRLRLGGAEVMLPTHGGGGSQRAQDEWAPSTTSLHTRHVTLQRPRSARDALEHISKTPTHPGENPRAIAPVQCRPSRADAHTPRVPDQER